MGRHMNLTARYEVLALNERHRMAIRLLAECKRRSEVAKELGICEATISRISNCTLGRAYMASLQSKLDRQLVEQVVAKKMRLSTLEFDCARSSKRKSRRRAKHA